MPTYLYETVPAAGEAARRFELRQHIDEPALGTDPETGEPVRRVISGGLGIVTRGGDAIPESGPGCGPDTCSCGRFS